MIRIQSPTRVDLAGGTLDLWPLYAFLGPSVTVNLAINLFTEVELSERNDRRIHVHSVDQNWTYEFADLAALQVDPRSQLALVKVVTEHFKPERGFNLKLYSQSPIGGGLGGSSSLVISLIKAFTKWTCCIVEPDRAIRLAKNLEAQLLRTPTGTQDYFPPIYGGLNVIYYGMDEVQTECLDRQDEFNERMVLVYTGRSHNSGINNWQVLKKAVEGDEEVLEALRGIQITAQKVAAVCQTARWDQLGPLLRDEYHWRLKLTPAFSSPEIEALARLGHEAGAEAIKICGAGGGGCVFLWCAPEKRQRVVDACSKNQFQVLAAETVAPLVVNA